MRERGQATAEYAGIGLLVLALLLGAAHTANAGLAATAGDAAYLARAQRIAPRIIPERGDDEVPVDFRTCRSRSCATGPPVLFVHAVPHGGYLYLEYWEYLPDSRTAHTGIAALDGAHADDWEGLIVKLRGDGTVVGARASAHLGWAGRHPWWDLARGDWAPYPATVYRAAGSHAGSFSPAGVDVAGDVWNGNGTVDRARLVPADEAARAGVRFDPGATAPWDKQVWSDPEAVTTGRPGSRAELARYARWWARVCMICANR
jgi:hypothetical protein